MKPNKSSVFDDMIMVNIHVVSHAYSIKEGMWQYEELHGDYLDQAQHLKYYEEVYHG